MHLLTQINPHFVIEEYSNAEAFQKLVNRNHYQIRDKSKLFDNLTNFVHHAHYEWLGLEYSYSRWTHTTLQGTLNYLVKELKKYNDYYLISYIDLSDINGKVSISFIKIEDTVLRDYFTSYLRRKEIDKILLDI